MPTDLRKAAKWAKTAVSRQLWPVGSVATIQLGPLRGMRYVVSEAAGWAPILGRWEPELQAMAKCLIRPGDVVWDLGANTGIHSLLFANLVGPSGSVVAFEPLESNCAEIRANCALNEIGTVTVVQRAVADTVGRATFKIGTHAKQGSLVGIGCETGEEVQVVTTTLDHEILSGRAPPNVVKIDIEGAEGAELASYSETVGRSWPTFVIDLHSPEQDLSVGRRLAADWGYEVSRLTGSGLFRSRLVPVARTDRSWPDPEGVWGTIVATHPSRGQRTPGSLA